MKLFGKIIDPFLFSNNVAVHNIINQLRGCALIHDPTIHDPTMHDSRINYAPCLLYIKIIHNITGRKNISMICKDLLSWMNKTSLSKEVGFFKNSHFLFFRTNMIFKSSRSQMFYKIGVLKNFAKFP